MNFMEERLAAARAVPEVRRCEAAAVRAGPRSHERSRRVRRCGVQGWPGSSAHPSAPPPAAPSNLLLHAKQAERTSEAAAFIEMYELAAEAQAFKDRHPDPLSGAGPIEWDRFWTGCFLRLARCHLAAPTGLRGGAGVLELEQEAALHLLRTCTTLYGEGGLLDAGAGFVPALSRAVGRLIDGGGLGLDVLARVAVGAQVRKFDAQLLAGLAARLQEPGASACVQAQLAAAQEGAPPARRLTCDQLAALLAASALSQGRREINEGTPALASFAAVRFEATRLVVRSPGIHVHVSPLPVCCDERFCAGIASAHGVRRPPPAHAGPPGSSCRGWRPASPSRCWPSPGTWTA
jgi:hypothetical protein